MIILCTDTDFSSNFSMFLTGAFDRRQKALVGQCSILSDDAQRGDLRSRRRSSWRHLKRESSMDTPTDGASVNGKDSSILGSSYSFGPRPSAIVNGGLVERALKAVIKFTLRALCLNHLLGEGMITIGPYIRFLWIISLGVLDFFLVLVLLFWPEKDFMCKEASTYREGAAPRVIEEDDIVATIGAILCLHFGDVVSANHVQLLRNPFMYISQQCVRDILKFDTVFSSAGVPDLC